MAWLIGLSVVAGLMHAASRAQRRRRAADRHTAPAHRARGVPMVGEAPVAVHHRMGWL